MNKYLYVLLLPFFTISISSQQYSDFNKNNRSQKSDAGSSVILGSLLVLTPTLVLQDSRSYFGLSKEFSAGKFPYGRLELDYTYVFRSEKNSMLHISYNIDIPMNFDFKRPSIFMLSPGAGYYTDLTNKSYFVQLAIGLWAATGFMEGLSIHPNVKFRNVFKNDTNPSIFSISIGVGFGFYSR